jgi:hypothetical protein
METHVITGWIIIFATVIVLTGVVVFEFAERNIKKENKVYKKFIEKDFLNYVSQFEKEDQIKMLNILLKQKENETIQSHN